MIGALLGVGLNALGSVANKGLSNMLGGKGEATAEAIYDKMKKDTIDNAWKSAEMKNVTALIRAGSGQ